MLILQHAGIMWLLNPGDEWVSVKHMRYILLPTFPSASAALDWVEARGRVIRVILTPAPDGNVRGLAAIEPNWALLEPTK